MTTLITTVANWGRIAAGIAVLQSSAWGQILEPELYARLPEISAAELSPGGMRFAARGRVEGRLGVIVHDLDGIATFGVPTDQPVEWLRWADDERLLVNLRLRDVPMRAGSQALLKINVDTRRVTDLYDNVSPTDVRQARVRSSPFRLDELVGVVREPQTTLLVSLAQQGEPTIFQMPSGQRLFALELDSGRLSLTERIPPNAAYWFADRSGTARIVATVSAQAIEYSGRAEGENNWSHMTRRNYEDASIFKPLAFDPFDQDTLYALSDHSDNVVGLYRWDMAANRFDDTAAVPLRPELHDVLFNPTRTEVYAVMYRTRDRAIAWLDPKHGDTFERIRRALPDRRVSAVTASDDLGRLIVRTDSAEAPGVYYLYTSSDDSLRTLGTAYPHWAGAQRSPTTRVSISTPNGASIAAYLRRPAIPPHPESAPGPAIVVPHGGPEARDYFEFDPLIETLVGRGYSVLQLNSHREDALSAAWSDDLEWRPASPGDVITATQWLAGQSFVDADRICIVGVEYGGYEALLAAAEAPSLYRCTATLNSPTDSRDLNLSVYRGLSQSAASELALHFRDIRTPVFLAHGEDNRHVSAQHARSLRRKLVIARQVAIFLPLEGEDHELLGSATRKRFIVELDSFLSRYLRP